MEMIRGLEHLSYEERLSLEKGRLRRDLIPDTVYQYLKGGYQMDAARLFPGVPRNSTGDKKLVHRKLHLNIRKKLITVRMTKHWKKLPREFIGSLEIFRSHSDTVLSNVLLRTLLKQESWTRRSPVAPSNLTHSMISWV